MQIAILGLGKMGVRIARKLSSEHEVYVWNRTLDDSRKFVEVSPSAKILESISEIKDFKSPRIIWVMLPAGEATVEVLYEIKKYISEGDVVVDGGNAYWKDTESRFQEFNNIGVNYLGIGVSGGIIAEKEGYPLMVGGSEKGYEIIIPILETLSHPNGGYEYFGTGGAGHFIKMVHNGVEYGMMQSIAEGFEILQKSQFHFNLPKIAKIWGKGSVVSGFLMNRAHDALIKNPALHNIIGEVEESGEAAWTLEAAEEEGVDARIIEESLEFRRRSQKDGRVSESFTARLLAVLRHEFGGHELKKKN